MGTTLDKHEAKVALKTGFYDGRLVEANETFVAPVSFTGKWFVPKSEVDSGAVAVNEPGFLDQPTKVIVPALSEKSVRELKALIAEEQAGQARKGLLAIMSDAVANRIGELDPVDDKKDDVFA